MQREGACPTLDKAPPATITILVQLQPSQRQKGAPNSRRPSVVSLLLLCFLSVVYLITYSFGGTAPIKFVTK